MSKINAKHGKKHANECRYYVGGEKEHTEAATTALKAQLLSLPCNIGLLLCFLSCSVSISGSLVEATEKCLCKVICLILDSRSIPNIFCLFFRLSELLLTSALLRSCLELLEGESAAPALTHSTTHRSSKLHEMHSARHLHSSTASAAATSLHTTHRLFKHLFEWISSVAASTPTTTSSHSTHLCSECLCK